MAFNLTANLHINATQEINRVARQLRTSLSGVPTNIDIRINRTNDLRGITSATNKLEKFIKVVDRIPQSANNATIALNNFYNSFSRGTNLGTGQTQVNRVTDTFSKLENEVGRASGRLQTFGDRVLLTAERFSSYVLVSSAIFSTIGAFSLGLKSAIDFERQLVRVSQVSGQTIGQLQGLTDEVTRLATGLGVSSTELVQASVTLSQAGFSAEETAKALETLAKADLSPTFNTIEESTEGAIAVMNQFGLSVDQLEDAFGSINQVAGQFAVESSDLINAIRIAGGVFAQSSAGIKQGNEALAEFLGLITAVRQTTRQSGNQIATALRTVIPRLQRPSTTSFLESLGIDVIEEGTFIGPFKALQEISKLVEQLPAGDPRIAQIIEQIAGIRQFARVLPILTNFNLALDAQQEALGGTESLSRDAATAQQALAIELTKVREEFLELTRNIVSSDAFQAIAKGATALARALINLGDAASDVLPILGLVLGIRAVRGLGNVTGAGTTFFGRSIPGSQTGGIVGLQSGGVVGGGGIKNVLINRIKDVDEKDLRAELSQISKTEEFEKLVNKRQLGGIVGLQDGGVFSPSADKMEVVPGSGSGDKILARVPAGSVVINRTAVRTLGKDNLTDFARKRFQKGGKPQTPNVILEPGEVVIGANKAKMIGADKLNAINKEIPRFRDGGLVGLRGGGLFKRRLFQNGGLTSGLPGAVEGVVIPEELKFTEGAKALRDSLNRAASQLEGMGKSALSVRTSLNNLLKGVSSPQEGLQKIDALVSRTFKQLGGVNLVPQITIPERLAGSALNEEIIKIENQAQKLGIPFKQLSPTIVNILDKAEDIDDALPRVKSAFDNLVKRVRSQDTELRGGGTRSGRLDVSLPIIESEQRREQERLRRELEEIRTTSRSFDTSIAIGPGSGRQTIIGGFQGAAQAPPSITNRERLADQIRVVRPSTQFRKTFDDLDSGLQLFSKNVSSLAKDSSVIVKQNKQNLQRFLLESKSIVVGTGVERPSTQLPIVTPPNLFPIISKKDIEEDIRRADERIRQATFQQTIVPQRPQVTGQLVRDIQGRDTALTNARQIEERVDKAFARLQKGIETNLREIGTSLPVAISPTGRIAELQQRLSTRNINTRNRSAALAGQLNLEADLQRREFLDAPSNLDDPVARAARAKQQKRIRQKFFSRIQRQVESQGGTFTPELAAAFDFTRVGGDEELARRTQPPPQPGFFSRQRDRVRRVGGGIGRGIGRANAAIGRTSRFIPQLNTPNALLAGLLLSQSLPEPQSRTGAGVIGTLQGGLSGAAIGSLFGGLGAALGGSITALNSFESSLKEFSIKEAEVRISQSLEALAEQIDSGAIRPQDIDLQFNEANKALRDRVRQNRVANTSGENTIIGSTVDFFKGIVGIDVEEERRKAISVNAQEAVQQARPAREQAEAVIRQLASRGASREQIFQRTELLEAIGLGTKEIQEQFQRGIFIFDKVDEAGQKVAESIIREQEARNESNQVIANFNLSLEKVNDSLLRAQAGLNRLSDIQRSIDIDAGQIEAQFRGEFRLPELNTPNIFENIEIASPRGVGQAAANLGVPGGFTVELLQFQSQIDDFNRRLLDRGGQNTAADARSSFNDIFNEVFGSLSSEFRSRLLADLDQAELFAEATVGDTDEAVQGISIGEFLRDVQGQAAESAFPTIIKLAEENLKTYADLQDRATDSLNRFRSSLNKVTELQLQVEGQRRNEISAQQNVEGIFTEFFGRQIPTERQLQNQQELILQRTRVRDPITGQEFGATTDPNQIIDNIERITARIEQIRGGEDPTLSRIAETDPDRADVQAELAISQLNVELAENRGALEDLSKNVIGLTAIQTELTRIQGRREGARSEVLSLFGASTTELQEQFRNLSAFRAFEQGGLQGLSGTTLTLRDVVEGFQQRQQFAQLGGETDEQLENRALRFLEQIRQTGFPIPRDLAIAFTRQGEGNRERELLDLLNSSTKNYVDANKQLTQVMQDLTNQLRERSILGNVAEGLGLAEVAKQLFIPETPEPPSIELSILERRAAEANQILRQIAENTGGFAPPVGEAAQRENRQRGGFIGGSGSGDRIPAMLEAGEFVLNRNAVSKVGVGTLNKINKGFGRFQTGGLVGFQQGATANFHIEEALSPRQSNLHEIRIQNVNVVESVPIDLTEDTIRRLCNCKKDEGQQTPIKVDLDLKKLQTGITDFLLPYILTTGGGSPEGNVGSPRRLPPPQQTIPFNDDELFGRKLSPEEKSQSSQTPQTPQDFPRRRPTPAEHRANQRAAAIEGRRRRREGAAARREERNQKRQESRIKRGVADPDLIEERQKQREERARRAAETRALPSAERHERNRRRAGVYTDPVILEEKERQRRTERGLQQEVIRDQEGLLRPEDFSRTRTLGPNSGRSFETAARVAGGLQETTKVFSISEEFIKKESERLKRLVASDGDSRSTSADIQSVLSFDELRELETGLNVEAVQKELERLNRIRLNLDIFDDGSANSIIKELQIAKEAVDLAGEDAKRTPAGKAGVNVDAINAAIREFNKFRTGLEENTQVVPNATTADQLTIDKAIGRLGISEDFSSTDTLGGVEASLDVIPEQKFDIVTKASEAFLNPIIDYFGHDFPNSIKQGAESLRDELDSRKVRPKESSVPTLDSDTRSPTRKILDQFKESDRQAEEENARFRARRERERATHVAERVRPESVGPIIPRGIGETTANLLAAPGLAPLGLLADVVEKVVPPDPFIDTPGPIGRLTNAAEAIVPPDPFAFVTQDPRLIGAGGKKGPVIGTRDFQGLLARVLDREVSVGRRISEFPELDDNLLNSRGEFNVEELKAVEQQILHLRRTIGSNPFHALTEASGIRNIDPSKRGLRAEQFAKFFNNFRQEILNVREAESADAQPPSAPNFFERFIPGSTTILESNEEDFVSDFFNDFLYGIGIRRRKPSPNAGGGFFSVPDTPVSGIRQNIENVKGTSSELFGDLVNRAPFGQGPNLGGLVFRPHLAEKDSFETLPFTRDAFARNRPEDFMQLLPAFPAQQRVPETFGQPASRPGQQSLNLNPLITAIDGHASQLQGVLSNSVGGFEGAFSRGSDAFLSILDNFQKVAESIHIPERVTLEATHTVNVQINGSEVFSRIQPEIAQLVVNTVRETFRNQFTPNGEKSDSFETTPLFNVGGN